MAKVTGIGGVFIKSTGDGAVLAKWYRDHLGIELSDFGGAILKWQDDNASDGGLTVWATADSNSNWFAPSSARFMINYRVDDLAGLLAQLKTAGVQSVAGPERHENGDFAWIMDPEGNKIELWQPCEWDDSRTENAN
ncbi:VOC family protein [Aliiroseovarius sp. F47248L]|uniref:VOC family protein n=1 Tax=Aliiroseovarius sp. F47248L TaxID=2926420 RepID=UPI001FF4C12B|nr:VOC family protein [Aliiroseovarius sp. F47248L]MCK0138786.1 VOC family protein [Aliiroseovarius sp. F47248L]